MPFIFQSCVDRQFPDKVIDIIDEACVTTRIDVMNKRKAYIDAAHTRKQKEVVTAHIRSNMCNVVGPNHVAQVCSLSNICVIIDDCFSVAHMFVIIIML
jgi:ATP-dependent Clp protease ATP-binding subunit ClpA